MQKGARTKKVTLDDLARMVKGGFDGVGKDILGLRGEVKQMQGEVKQIRSEVKQIQGEVKQIRSEVKQVREGVDRIENLVLPDHKRRIEHLEIDMRSIKDIFALK